MWRDALAHTNVGNTLGVTITLLWIPSAMAGFAIHTESDPLSWRVGREEVVSVWIDEAALPAPLLFVGTTVEFSAALLGQPTQFEAGEIIPSPTWDPLDLAFSAGPGIADASFATSATSPDYMVTSPGRFFSFRVLPIAAGTGTLEFTFAQALYSDPLTGDAIDSELGVAGIVAYSVYVPAPAAASLVACGCMLPGGRRRSKTA